jgi:hypothetical protein
MKKREVFLISLIFISAMALISAEAISEDLHLNIQTTTSAGAVTTGTFDFVFNISTSSDCNNVVYSNITSLTTDSRGIVSHYLTNVSLNYSDQYYLCYYRNGVLINASKITRTPYTFRARNITLSGVEADSNFNMSGYNLSAQYFVGDGSQLTGVSTYNSTYANFAYNQTLPANAYTNEVNTSQSNWVTNTFAKLLGGNEINGTQNFNGGWNLGGLTIVNGNLFAQTIYVYNLSSLSVSTLNINGSLIPEIGFDNIFDLGSSTLRWRDVFASRNITSQYFVGSGEFLTNVSTYNETYAGAINNASYLSTYNATYDAKNSSRWDLVNGNISYSGGNVGIGTTTPVEDLSLYNENSGVLGGEVSFEQNSSSPANSDVLGRIYFRGNNASGSNMTYAYLDGAINDVTNGRGKFTMNLRTTGGGYNTHVFTDTSISLVNGVILTQSSKPFVVLGTGTSAQAGSTVRIISTNSPTAGNTGFLEVTGTYSASGTAGLSALKINPTMTSGGSGGWKALEINLSADVGTGDKYFIWAGVNSRASFVVDNNSQVGIGTSAPTEKLFVNGSLRVQNSSGTLALYVNESTGNVGIGTITPFSLFETKKVAGTNEVNLSGVLYVNSTSGNVGIGTTTPLQKLEVIGNVYLTMGANRFMRIGSSSNYFYDLQGTGDDFQIIEAGDANKVRLHIDYPNGNVGIGTTSPTAKLHVTGGTTIFGNGTWPTGTIGQSSQRVGILDNAQSGLLIVGDMQSGVGVDRGGAIYLGARGTDSTDNFAQTYIYGARESAVSGTLSTYLSFATSNAAGATTEKLRIASDGTFTGSATNDISDLRLKKNITELNSSLEKIMQLRGVSFNWKEEAKMTDRLQYGVIAQEVEPIFPELVLNTSIFGDGYKSVQYSGFVAPFIEAIKELSNWNTNQDEEIEELRTENDLLKSELCSKDNSYSWC